ncbi:MAG: hypothetical protein EOQ39_03640 [Mesorhizobium sp.]|uniref:hypothetical protein n=1 Tax=Mesorhizobium sp. TaxID=1871066 RepID=UPI000FE75561|nr:hypothetical protein [Mesorhizobium sp.]RWB09003.1 MAG: hypothetical protein EOQ37_05795 [Mesorhizobium sp.]RWB17424.1 MAG: hypothetical protein EOQ39_03640 [Mesorhizobium sp.]
MQFGEIGLDDVAKAGALCVGATAAAFVVKATGYFYVVGPEFIGLYLDSNMLSGIFYAAPYVFSIISVSVYVYYLIYKSFGYFFDDETEIINLLLFYDKILVIPVIVAVIFAKGEWIMVESIIFLFSSFVIGGIVFFQYFHFKSYNSFNVVVLLFSIYNTIYIGGKAEAVFDLSKKGPLFDVYTEESNFINAVSVKWYSNSLGSSGSILQVE